MNLSILDTDTLTLFQDGHPQVCQRARDHAEAELAITVLSVEEQLSGWYTVLRQAKRPPKLAWAYRRLAETVRFLSRMPIVALDEPAIERYDTLIRLGRKVRKMDLRIAAVVLEVGAPLVTRNVRDIKRIPGLVVTDWSRA